MDGYLMGYARVSTQEQNLDRQIDQLKEIGCQKIFEEKVTASKKDRPELTRLMDELRSADTVVVIELTRLSRSTKDLFKIAEEIEAKGANLKSLKESWVDTTTPQGKLMFTIFSGISQFERDLIRQRTVEGLESARARGRNGGRPSKNRKDIELAIKMYNSNLHSVSDIEKATGVSKSTLYRYIKNN